MPVVDPDGGLTFQGYDIGTLQGAKRLPVDKTATLPFYFGGSEVPVDLGISKQPTQQLKQSLALQKVYKLPSIRK